MKCLFPQGNTVIDCKPMVDIIYDSELEEKFTELMSKYDDADRAGQEVERIEQDRNNLLYINGKSVTKSNAVQSFFLDIMDRYYGANPNSEKRIIFKNFGVAVEKLFLRMMFHYINYTLCIRGVAIVDELVVDDAVDMKTICNYYKSLDPSNADNICKQVEWLVVQEIDEAFNRLSLYLSRHDNVWFDMRNMSEKIPMHIIHTALLKRNCCVMLDEKDLQDPMVNLNNTAVFLTEFDDEIELDLHMYYYPSKTLENVFEDVVSFINQVSVRKNIDRQHGVVLETADPVLMRMVATYMDKESDLDAVYFIRPDEDINNLMEVEDE